MLEKMREKPYVFAARLANKFESLATRVAEPALKVARKAASFGAKMTQRAEKIQARATARQTARAIKAMQKRPSIQHLRELRHGQTTINFYRSVDRRDGKVRDYWTLSRDTNGGRVRLATGTMEEFKSIRHIGREAVRQDLQGRRQVARAQESRPKALEHSRAQEPRKAQETTHRENRPGQHWYTLIHVEASKDNGRTGTARVVKSFRSLEEAQAVRAKQPWLALHRHTYTTPPRRNDIVSVKASDSPEIASHLGKLARQARGPVNGHDPAAVATPRANTQQLKRDQQLSQGR